MPPTIGSNLGNIPQPVPASTALRDALQATLRQIAAHLNQPLLVNTSAGAPSGGTVTYTLQVVNSDRRACSGLYKLEVFVSESVGGAPGGTQTETWLTGTPMDTLEAGRRWAVLTNRQGQASLRLAFSGTRAVHAGVLAVYEASPAKTA